MDNPIEHMHKELDSYFIENGRPDLVRAGLMDGYDIQTYADDPYQMTLIYQVYIWDNGVKYYKNGY